MVVRLGPLVSLRHHHPTSLKSGSLMKVFHCGRCDQIVFFESNNCVRCGGKLAYLPDRGEVGTLEPETDEHWRVISTEGPPQAYRLCRNYSHENVCNWAVQERDGEPYCIACRLNRVIPNLSRPGARESWAKLEAAKRRLIYTVLELGLPLSSKSDDPERGLAFEFLAEPEPGAPGPAPIRTGHLGGVITINLAEADDAERERRRLEMYEPYRTLLGHFRHEIGHYYWDRLIRDTDHIHEFRELFGDERQDYADRLARHHAQGAPADWSGAFVTAYASSHPWEDWAESWAHYMHIVDTLEAALRCGVSIRSCRDNEPHWKPDGQNGVRPLESFDQMIGGWFPLTYLLNNLNRCMGLQDPYPFVLSTPVLHKLKFIHDTVQACDLKVALA
jgi:hypothetical protein